MPRVEVYRIRCVLTVGLRRDADAAVREAIALDSDSRIDRIDGMLKLKAAVSGRASSELS